MFYSDFMNTLLLAEMNMTQVVFLQLILPIVICLWLRKKSHEFQRNYIKFMLVLGLGLQAVLLWWLYSLTPSSP